MATLRLLRLRNYPIFEQLRVEEALLRTTTDCWCVLNDGTPEPAIVMGISGKSRDLIHEEAAKAASIQVIKRFSGGGTVVVDRNTVFATLIMPEAAVPGVQSYPKAVMQWSRDFYRPIFSPYGDFNLREHDYVFGELKFGGNAQAITKQRWLHHTSFLWTFEPERMSLLKHPVKTPAYRAGREHGDFVCQLKDFVPDRQKVLDAIPERLTQLGFKIEEGDIEEARELLNQDYVKSNRLITLP